MTDDRLMLAARAAGYAMIPPQDASETEPEMVTADEPTVELSTLAATSFARLRSWLPATRRNVHAGTVRDAVANWLQSRAHA